MNAKKVTKVKSDSSQDEVGTSSTNTSLKWNATCRRSLRSSGVSKLAKLSQRVAHSLQAATRLKSVEKSSGDPAPKTAAPKDPTPCTLKKEVEKSEDPTVGSLCREIAQKTSVTHEVPVKKMEQPYSEIPVYHIRFDGCGDGHKQFGEKCILCNNDLSRSPCDVDRGPRADDEHKYRVKFTPLVLPGVDILPCGHAIHTECSKHVMSAESNVPRCILCLSMP